MTLKNWHIVVVIIGLIILLIISGAIQYHYAQKQVKDLTARMIEVENQNKQLVGALYGLYETITPTHELTMFAFETKIKEGR